MRRHVILVGLPGSGKSTVAPLVAEWLGAACVDLDRAIESRDGRTVRRIFEEDGEAAFRMLEEMVGRETLAAPPCVVAAGGGFLEQPALRQLALGSALVIHLKTSPATAAGRIGDAAARPLLKGGDPVVRIRSLYERRDALYRQAQQHVTTDGLTPAEVAELVVALARAEGGW